MATSCSDHVRIMVHFCLDLKLSWLHFKCMYIHSKVTTQDLNLVSLRHRHSVYNATSISNISSRSFAYFRFWFTHSNIACFHIQQDGTNVPQMKKSNLRMKVLAARKGPEPQTIFLVPQARCCRKRGTPETSETCHRASASSL